MTKTCILCGDLLSKHPTNREHYVPQVLIRDFVKLCIPTRYDWAIRLNEYVGSSHLDDELTSVPITSHKKWAVVEVHEKCNLEASGMCQDLRYIIDNIDSRIDFEYFRRPLEYYSKIWHVDISNVEAIISTISETKKRLKEESMILYRPGLLDCGRIQILNKKLAHLNMAEQHTIYIGTRDSFDQV